MTAAASLAGLLAEIIRPDESIAGQAQATSGLIAATDRRVIVVRPPRQAALLPIGQLRRIQFDIEKGRPATLVLVPDSAEEPVVLTIPPDQYKATAETLAAIGQRLHELAEG